MGSLTKGRYRAHVLTGFVGVVASVFVLGACSEAEPGTATPAPGAVPTAGQESSGSPVASAGSSPSSTVNRPREIDLTGVDACELGQKMPLAQLGFRTDNVDEATPSGSFPGNKECVFLGVNDGPSLLVSPVTNEGMAHYLTTIVDDVTHLEAAGFPAIVVKPKRTQTACFGVVDVADDQLLSVKVSQSIGPAPTQDSLCALIPAIAAAAVTAAGS
jgi:Protein of unknown function (DUF3558)